MVALVITGAEILPSYSYYFIYHYKDPQLSKQYDEKVVYIPKHPRSMVHVPPKPIKK